jgi:hypothetical protein
VAVEEEGAGASAYLRNRLPGGEVSGVEEFLRRTRIDRLVKVFTSSITSAVRAQKEER